MKKRLLRPPQNHGEIIFLPDLERFISQINSDSIIGTAHQPYFFHPGISLKFISLEKLSCGSKRMIFLDSDMVKITVKIPAKDRTELIFFINSDSVLDGYPTPEEKQWDDFFDRIESCLRQCLFNGARDILDNFLHFKDIFFKNSRHKLLKEVLAESFLQFYSLKSDYCFLSDLTRTQEFQQFLLKIYNEAEKFQEIFNTALDEYRQNFRFRYKNFPFPKLQDDELPFWIIKEDKRIKCFRKDLALEDIKRSKIFPRAVTLTLFLRLYQTNFFVHGIGGANYEWVQDRIIERFFKQQPPAYAVISGTFLINDFKEREFPYFLFSPEKIKESYRLRSCLE